MSYKLEVLAAGETKWCSNQLRFATKGEAAAYGNDLAFRWTAVQQKERSKGAFPRSAPV